MVKFYKTHVRASYLFLLSDKALILALCLIGPQCAFAGSEETKSVEMQHDDNAHNEAAHSKVEHGDKAHGQMKHDEIKHGEMKHGQMKHGEMTHDELTHANMTHAPVDVSDWPAKPTLTLTAQKDTMAGWNLHIEPTNFSFAPEHVNTANVVGEGHAHLYVDGDKITRLYSGWFYLNNLTPGTHTVTVTLNANDHGELVLKGQAVSASIEIIQK